MRCPKCGLINPETALRCDCGYDFAAKQMADDYLTGMEIAGAGKEYGTPEGGRNKSSLPQASSPTILPQAAGVLYLLLGAYGFVVGWVQLLIGLSDAIWPGTIVLPRGTVGTIVIGAWDAGASIIFFVIAISLFRRSRRGYNWGLGSAILNIPVVLVTGGLNCLTVPILAVYAIAAVLLWISRGEFKTREHRIAVAISTPQGPQPANALPVTAPTPESSRWAVVLAGVLVVAALCAFSCFGLAVIGILYNGLSQQVFLPPEELSPDQTAATATGVAKANARATWQAEPRAANPVGLSWTVVVSDTFDTSGNYWRTGRCGAIKSKSIADGKYTLSLAATEPVISRELREMIPVADMEVSIDARRVGGAEQSGYGLVFRNNMSGNYLFLISDDQTYEFRLGGDCAAPFILKSGKSPAIHPGAVNSLKVVAQGLHFTFFVNNQPVVQADDDTLAYGVAGLAALSSNVGDETVLEFDNFQVRVLLPDLQETRDQLPLVLSGWTAANKEGWPTGDYEVQGSDHAQQVAVRGNRQIVDGKYNWSTKNAAEIELIAAPAMTPVSDLYVSVDARKLSDSGKAQYGLVFRHTDPDSEYIFFIQDSGSYTLTRCDMGKCELVTDSWNSPGVRPGQTNRLEVIAVGSVFILYINGQAVAQVDDSTLWEGRVGIAVEAYDEENPQAIFEFNNFELRAP